MRVVDDDIMEACPKEDTAATCGDVARGFTANCSSIADFIAVGVEAAAANAFDDFDMRILRPSSVIGLIRIGCELELLVLELLGVLEEDDELFLDNDDVFGDDDVDEVDF